LTELPVQFSILGHSVFNYTLEALEVKLSIGVSFIQKTPHLHLCKRSSLNIFVEAVNFLLKVDVLLAPNEHLVVLLHVVLFVLEALLDDSAEV
jgi:hypothetical protein